METTAIGKSMMLELTWALEEKRQALRRRLLGKYARDDYLLHAMAGAVLLASLASLLFPPAAFMGLAGLITVAELAFLGLVLLISVVASPIALILF